MDEKVLEQEQLSATPQPQSFGLSKVIVTLLIVFVVAGLYIGFQFGKNDTKTEITNTEINMPTISPTRTLKPTQIIRPTDPIVNGKKFYSTKGFGMTFEYPSEWNVTEEFIDPDVSDGKNESHLQVGKLFIVSDQHPDGPGDNSPILYKEMITIDQSPRELVVRSYCWDEEILGVSEKCGKIYGRIELTIDEGDNYLAFFGPEIVTKEDIQKELEPIKALLASVKLTK